MDVVNCLELNGVDFFENCSQGQLRSFTFPSRRCLSLQVVSWRALRASQLDATLATFDFYFQIQRSQSFALVMGNLISVKTVQPKRIELFSCVFKFQWAWRRNGKAPPKHF